MHDLVNVPTRRRFLERVAAVAAVPLVPSLFRGEPGKAPATKPSPDERWLRTLNRKHRMAFDVETHKGGNALLQAKNYMDNWRDAFGVPEREINLVMAVRGTGIPIVLTDALWQKYKLGEQYGITDPSTKAPGTRNLFIQSNSVPNGIIDAESTVEALQRRGVLFLVCHNTVEGATKKLSAAGLGKPEDIRESILHGIIPGVLLVPAMVIAFTEMQERGVGYVYAG